MKNSLRVLTYMMIFIGLMVVGPSCSESETEDSTSNASAEKAAATVEAPESNKLVIYSGRSEKLVGPVIEQSAQTSGLCFLPTKRPLLSASRE